MAHFPEAYQHCAALLRERDPDRFFASLFVPQAARGGVQAIHAFSDDLAGIRDAIRDPMAGEIRLQWWREALTGEGRGEVSAHPVAAALIDTIERFNLPPQALLQMIDARSFDLYDDPMPSMASLEGYAGETASLPMRLAALVIAGGTDPGGADAAGHAGVALSVTGLLRAFPWHARRGQVFLPMDRLTALGVTRDTALSGSIVPELNIVLAEMRKTVRRHITAFGAHLADVAPEVRAAFLPVALCEGYLRRMERPSYDPYRTLIDRPQWRKQWTLWYAARQWARAAP